MEKKEHFYIQGMTCASCELLIERKIKKIPGVLGVHSNFRTGFTVVKMDPENPAENSVIISAIREAGYALKNDKTSVQAQEPGKWMEIGASLVLIFALYKIFQGFDLIAFTDSASGVADLAGVFLIGLVAGSSSCLAVTGGLLLAMAAKVSTANVQASRWDKFKPLLIFNSGRLLSYFFLGGLIGLLGQSLTLSPEVTGYITVGVAVLMLALALSILKILPKNVFMIRMPKVLSHWIVGFAEHPHPFAPFILGALTFFLPCGFTQSLQISALASGSFMEGALTLFVFSLGTLPALLGISAISAYSKGRTAHLFLRFTGSLVLILALFNLKSGLVLAGVDLEGFLPSRETTQVFVEDGVQVIHLEATPYAYSPSSIEIQAGIPTRIDVEVSNSMGGCASFITVPEYGFSAVLESGQDISLGTISNPQEDFIITCSMGMITSRVTVLDPL